MELEKFYKLTWEIFSRDTGASIKKGQGTYLGTSLTEAQRDAMEDIEDFDPDTMDLVFCKHYFVVDAE